MIIGAAYYPEHWNKERWETDCRLMAEMGLNTVRLGEFGWSVIEKEEGFFDFTLFDEAISLLSDYGISVILGTPTATPPAWLCKKYSDIFMEDRMGRRRGFGSRRHYCYNHKGFQRAATEITTVMAEHYKDNPNVIAWQIDNELGCEDEVRCYCETCRKEFIHWLEEKYKTLDHVNEAWGTVFWSQTYTEWDQIQLPKQTVVDAYTGYGHNPGLLLDYARFSSDSLIEFAREQRDVLKKYVNQPVLHNMVSEYCDNYKLAKYLDGLGYDAYPRSEWDRNSPGRIGFYYDLTRGYQENVPFWILEQQSGPCGWNIIGDTPETGQLRLWSLQGAARGTEGIIYFRWRSCLFGTEQFWYGILNHDGVPGKRYEELKKTIEDIKKYESVLKCNNMKEVLLVYNYDNKFSHEFQPHIKGFCYREEVVRYYEALQNLHIPVDVGGIERDLSEYHMVILPFMSIISKENIKRMEDYVSSGGILVLTPFSGMREMSNQITEQTLPGAFRRLSGIEVNEFFYAEGKRKKVIAFGSESQDWGEASGWCEVLNIVEAEALAEYDMHRNSNSEKGSHVAVARNHIDKGRVYYVGSLYEDYTQLMKNISQYEKIKTYDLPSTTECIAKEKGEYLVVLNHSSEAKEITIQDYQTMDGRRLPVYLEGYGMEILTVRKS